MAIKGGLRSAGHPLTLLLHLTVRTAPLPGWLDSGLVPGSDRG